MHISWARLASFCHLGFISDPLIVSKFQNETHDPKKKQENKIYTIVKGRETFYRRHTVPVTSCSEIKYVLKSVSFGSKDCTKDLKLECAFSWARLASFCHLGFISDPLIVSKFHNETHDPKGQENNIHTLFWYHLMQKGKGSAVPEDAIPASVKTAVHQLSFNKFPMVLNAAISI